MRREVRAAEQIGDTVLRKASVRLLPLLGLGYAIAYIDRLNIGFAALQMNEQLNFSASVYGLGAGLFFVTYALCEVPSNLMLLRFGARRWLARIMLSWGVLSMAMMFVSAPWQFYLLRLLLGAAEAGFFPGVVYFLHQWFPADYRGRAISRFYAVTPIANGVMGVAAGLILSLGGVYGLAGWQWLFLLEGLPAVFLAFVLLRRLTDRPSEADWLTAAEREWLVARVGGDTSPQFGRGAVLQVMKQPTVLLFGVASFFLFATNYAFSFFAPILLKSSTALSIAEIGYVSGSAGAMGLVAILLSGWISDLHEDRLLQSALLMCAGACGLSLIVFSHSNMSMVVAGYLIFAMSSYAIHGVLWAVPGELLRGQAVAVAIAGINTLGMIGGFLSPIAWGSLHDGTGSYQLGLQMLPVTLLISALTLMALRSRMRSDRRIESP